MNAGRTGTAPEPGSRSLLPPLGARGGTRNSPSLGGSRGPASSSPWWSRRSPVAVTPSAAVIASTAALGRTSRLGSPIRWARAGSPAVVPRALRASRRRRPLDRPRRESSPGGRRSRPSTALVEIDGGKRARLPPLKGAGLESTRCSPMPAGGSSPRCRKERAGAEARRGGLLARGLMPATSVPRGLVACGRDIPSRVECGRRWSLLAAMLGGGRTGRVELATRVSGGGWTSSCGWTSS